MVVSFGWFGDLGCLWSGDSVSCGFLWFGDVWWVLICGVCDFSLGLGFVVGLV